MSDTPRTDAQLSVTHWNTYCLNEREGTDYVPATFARELERELTIARATCAELVTDGNAITLAETVVKLERECAALQVEYESRTAWIATMNKILGYDNTDGFHSEPDPFTIASNLVAENKRLLEQVATIPFPNIVAGNASAIAYEIEQGHRARVKTTTEAKAKWLRELSAQLTAFDKLNTP